MGRLGSAKVWKNNIPEFIRRYNSLIDLLDRETRYEGKIGDNNVVIVINPVDGFRITVNGIETFYLDPLSGSITVTQYDAEFLKVVYKDTFTEHSILKVDTVPSGSDPVPSPLTVAEGTLVGRIPGGAIAALTIEQVVNLLALQAGDVSIHDEDNLFTSSTVEGALAEAMTNVNGIIATTVPYNNSSSSLTSTTVQDAIDELSDRDDFQYVHSQDSPLATWVIIHGMNRYPQVSVVDSSGSEVYGDIEYDSANQLTVSFSSAFSGKAYLD
jgi:hypothetical protein